MIQDFRALAPHRHRRSAARAARGWLAAFLVCLVCVAGARVRAADTITTFASSITPAAGGAVTLAQPAGVATDAAGNVYVADTGNCVVWQFPVNGLQPLVFAGQLGKCAGSYASTTPTQVSLNRPIDVTACGNSVFIADTGSASSTGLHKVTGGTFSNVAINFSQTPALQGAVQPQAIACDAAGDLFVQSTFHSTDYNTPLYSIDTVSAGGTSLNVGIEFDQVYQGVVLDALGNVYTVRGQTNGVGLQSIAKFTPSIHSNWPLQVLPQSRLLTGATRIALDTSGNFFVTESTGAAGSEPVYLTEISPSAGGYSVATIAGNGKAGFAGDGGPALAAELDDVNGIAVGTSIYAADTGNNRVRRLYQVPSTLTMADRIPNLGFNSVVNPTTHKLYVAVSKGNYLVGGPVNDIVVYSTIDDSVIANIPYLSSMGGVTALALDATNNVIYAARQGGTVSVIDGATDTVNATLNVGKAPLGIGVDPGSNLAYVANSLDTFISVIHGPTRDTTGTITAAAYTSSSENIGNLLPLGAVAVDTNRHTAYAIVAGASNLGSQTYALAIINGLSLASTVSYLSDSSSTNIQAAAIGIDQRSGQVVIADSADQAVHVYSPASGAFQSYSESFYPTQISVDSANDIAYASTGYGNIAQINLASGGQVTVSTPSVAAGSPQSCGFGGTSVAVDPGVVQAYFTTCDGTNGAVLHLWNGAGSQAVTTFALGSPAGSFGNVSGSFAVTVDASTHVAYVANSLPNTSEIDVFNGPVPAARPQLTITPSSFAFGSVAVGQSSATQTFVITNNGTAVATVGLPTALGTAGFAVAGGSCSAALPLSTNGGSCTAGAAFTPVLNVASDGGLAFFDNAPDTPQLVGLTGTGTGTHTLTISPSSVPLGYEGLPYADGFGVTFGSPNAAGVASFNICATLPSGQASSVCCPASQYDIGPGCPAGLLPNGLSWMAPQLAGTPFTGSAGTYPFTVVASDTGGDSGSQNYSLVVDAPFTLALAVANASVIGGAGDIATVTLSAPAPSGGAVVFINSGNTAVIASTVLIVNAGQLSATVPLAISAVASPDSVTLTAFYDGNTSSQTLLVTPPIAPGTASISLTESVGVSDVVLFDDAFDAEQISVSDAVALSADVPNIIGDSQSAADGILQSAGLNVGTVTYATSLAPAGTVIGESPGPTTTETPGEPITLVISLGPPTPASITVNEAIGVADLPSLPTTVPRVTGETLAQAESNLGLAGLLATPITSQPSGAVAAGIVLNQSPGAGAGVSAGSKVALVVSSGAPSVTIMPAGAPSIARSPNGFLDRLIASVPLKNTGNVTATAVTETTATLNGFAGTPVVGSLSNLAPGVTGTLVLSFPASAGSKGAVVRFATGGSFTASGASGGQWTYGFRVTLP